MKKRQRMGSEGGVETGVRDSGLWADWSGKAPPQSKSTSALTLGGRSWLKRAGGA